MVFGAYKVPSIVLSSGNLPCLHSQIAFLAVCIMIGGCQTRKCRIMYLVHDPAQQCQLATVYLRSVHSILGLRGTRGLMQQG